MPDFPLMGPDGFAAAVAFNLLFGRSHDRSKRLSELKTSGFTDKSKKTTCPVCGRTLVNIYERDGDWKCYRCWSA